MTPSLNSFFQIITNSAFLEGKMKFPNKYAHEHGNKLHDTVGLSIPTGCCWDVKVEREADGTVWLSDGFFQFMEDNSIRVEYFLTFHGEGNSKFVVHIFDITATEILYKCSNDSGRDCSFNQKSSYEDSEEDSSENGSSNEDSDDHTDDYSSCESGDADEDDDDDDDYSPTNRGGGKAPLTRRKITEAGLDANGSTPKTDTTNKYSKKEANQSRDDGSNISPTDIAKETITKAKKVHPMVPNSFQLHMRPYQITKGIIRLPSAFARSHMCCSTRVIKLVDTDNNEWEVQYIHREINYFLSKGWLCVVQDKGLKVGDICEFERVGSTDDVKLKMTII